ncbi:MAG: hypothetical protein KAG66_02680 [Methylococcales bacterium]|nr:hypothetical protein [Methylococcales bacterium]
MRLDGKSLRMMRKALMQCDITASNESVRGLFADERIYPWRNQISEANSPSGRADAIISKLHNRRNRAGENALALFFAVAGERFDEQDSCYELIDGLSRHLNGQVELNILDNANAKPVIGSQIINIIAQPGSRVEVVQNKKTHTGDVVQGDKIEGDRVGGDRISVGDISDVRGVAIGREARAEVHIEKGLSADELNQLFAPLLVAVAIEAPVAIDQLLALKVEAGKLEQADDGKMAGLIEAIATAAPSAVEGLVDLFANSVVSRVTGGATQYVLNKIGH